MKIATQSRRSILLSSFGNSCRLNHLLVLPRYCSARITRMHSPANCAFGDCSPSPTLSYHHISTSPYHKFYICSVLLFTGITPYMILRVSPWTHHLFGLQLPVVSVVFYDRCQVVFLLDALEHPCVQTWICLYAPARMHGRFPPWTSSATWLRSAG